MAFYYVLLSDERQWSVSIVVLILFRAFVSASPRTIHELTRNNSKLIRAPRRLMGFVDRLPGRQSLDTQDTTHPSTFQNAAI